MSLKDINAFEEDPTASYIAGRTFSKRYATFLGTTAGREGLQEVTRRGTCVIQLIYPSFEN